MNSNHSKYVYYIHKNAMTNTCAFYKTEAHCTYFDLMVPYKYKNKMINLLSYSIWPSMPEALVIVKCWNISHHSHIRHYIYHIFHFNHEVREVHENMHVYVYGSDDWYFIIWHVSMSLEFHWQFSNWVGPMSLSLIYFYLNDYLIIFW